MVIVVVIEGSILAIITNPKAATVVMKCTVETSNPLHVCKTSSSAAEDQTTISGC